MDYEESLQLTEHEIRVLRLVAQGLTNNETAQSLEITERTVAYHLGKIFQRLNVTSCTSAVVTAHKLGLLDV